MTPIDEAIAAVRRGDVVVIPTDTVYGIGARADDADATAKVFAAKGRPRDLTLPVLVADEAAARAVAVFDFRADRIAAATWPGSVTMVLPRTEVSARWDLGGDKETVGVRVPAHPLARAVLLGSGPLAVSSANRSGEAPCTTSDELFAAFGDDVAVYLCEDAPRDQAPSTVVDLAHGPLRVLRPGDFDEEQLGRIAEGR